MASEAVGRIAGHIAAGHRVEPLPSNGVKTEVLSGVPASSVEGTSVHIPPSWGGPLSEEIGRAHV